MKTIFKLITFWALTVLVSCDYLDIVPDNVATIDYAFRNRTEAEKYLYTCYSYRPQIGDIPNDPAMGGGDEIWRMYRSWYGYWSSTRIAMGQQNVNEPWLNFWNGTQGAKALWRGIRDCNIFLENIDKALDLEEYEKVRWIGEVKVLKAYFHYYLFKCYGPIPIVDKNLPISTGVSDVKAYREPVDDVVAYISGLLLEAVEDLPNAKEVLEGTEAGRIDKLGALSIRAELLLFAASPLFNGNNDYSGMVDGQGRQLYNTTYDANKWKIAADACKEVIDLCHSQGKALYDVVDPLTANSHEIFQLQTTLRQTICDRWNKELIWGSTNYDCNSGTRQTTPRIVRTTNVSNHPGSFAPTLKMAEQFYSHNGVPINEDKEWQSESWYENRYSIRQDPSSGDEIYYVKEGQRTVYLHYNREPRFYSSLAFDRAIYFGCGYYNFPSDVKHLEGINLEYSGYQGGDQYAITGYFAKKLNNFKNIQQVSSYSVEYYPFPIMRLANLYLMYAEALNEFGGPNDEVFTYLDLIRARAGLKGVRESWANYSTRPDKPGTKDGLREIIRQERTVELAFEGKRFWDIRRWKLIQELNDQPQGWNVLGETIEDYYKVVPVAQAPVKFTIKDYFWPLKESDLISNRNLIQNYGW
jgi:hypothetical protein